MSFPLHNGASALISNASSSTMSSTSKLAASFIPPLEIILKRRFEAISPQILDYFCKRLSHELQTVSITPTTIYQLIYDILTFQNAAWASTKSIPGVPCKIPLSLLLSFGHNSALEAVVRYFLGQQHTGMPKIDEQTFSAVFGVVMQPPYFVFPKIHVSNECSDMVELERIAIKYGATIVDLSFASHIVLPPSSMDSHSHRVRPLEFDDASRSVLVHFIGHSSSSDAWINETNLENFNRSIQSLPVLPTPIPVSVGYIRDLENHGEWLCEYDYFEGPMAQIDLEPVFLISKSKKRLHDEVLNGVEVQDEAIDVKKVKMESTYGVKRHEFRKDDLDRGISGAYSVLTQPSLDIVAGGSASGEMTSVGGVFLGNEKESNAQPSLVLPPHCEWFKMNEISERERKALPEYFVDRAARSSNKSAEIYREYRDFMIHTYQQNPSQYLTYTSCRRSLAGDACAVLRVFDFLESSGLINYASSHSSDSHGFFPSHSPSIPLPPPSELAQHLLKVDNPPHHHTHHSHHSHHSNTTTNTNTNTNTSTTTTTSTSLALQMALKDFSKFPHPPPNNQTSEASTSSSSASASHNKIPSRKCNHCTQANSQIIFIHSQPGKNGPIIDKNAEKVCRDCFSQGFQSHNPSEYQLLDQRSEKIFEEDRKPWSDSETLCLLDALEQFGDDWDKVALYVGSRDKHACLLHFLRLPIDDPFVPQLPLNTSSNKSSSSSSPSSHSNPLLPLITFLTHTVSPTVAAAASQAAIKTFINENFKTKHSQQHQHHHTSSLSNNMDIDPTTHDTHINGGNDDSEDKINENLQNLQNLTSVASAGLSAAVLKSILLAEKEERDIRMITHQIVDATTKKLELKMKYFDELEHFLQEEHKKLEVSRIRILDEKWHLEQEKRSFHELKTQVEQQAQQMGFTS